MRSIYRLIFTQISHRYYVVSLESTHIIMLSTQSPPTLLFCQLKVHLHYYVVNLKSTYIIILSTQSPPTLLCCQLKTFFPEQREKKQSWLPPFSKQSKTKTIASFAFISWTKISTLYFVINNMLHYRKCNYITTCMWQPPFICLDLLNKAYQSCSRLKTARRRIYLWRGFSSRGLKINLMWCQWMCHDKIVWITCTWPSDLQTSWAITGPLAALRCAA